VIPPVTGSEHLHASLTEWIGNTPLVPIEGIDDVPHEVTMLSRAEWFNPGVSVKDRAAWGMVSAAERSGVLAPGAVMLDATSGNTGNALAWIGAARDCSVTLCLPANASLERGRTLEALGSNLVLTDAMEGTNGASRYLSEPAWEASS
jgi:cysteine synthase B